jgi:methionyl-tRNA synthetase
MEKSLFITTSIAYINAEPHIGFLFELLGADVIARYHRLQGREVFFLTGTDEHGLKIAQKAEELGKKPQELADEVSSAFKKLCEDFNISNDYFIRTTSEAHKKFVQEKWQQLEEKGLLQKRTYKGHYCVGCEAFKTERELQDGKCVIHEKAVEITEEENWFFLLTKFKDQIEKWLESDVIEPAHKKNEVRNMLDGLEDLSFSRPKDKLAWGVTVPGDDSQVMYVWADALWNYISGIEAAGKKPEELWPADIQVIGKDILKFHAIFWPAILSALGYELPKKLLVHGFINSDGKKMSKSLGNVIAPVDLKERYGVDGTRYLLLRQLNFYDDSNFVWDEFDSLYNGELANGIGNLTARVVGLSKKVGQHYEFGQESEELSVLDFAAILRRANELVSEADKIITENKLWEQIETDTSKQNILKEVAEKIWKVSILLDPFIPTTSQEIRRQLTELDPKPLFPRLEKTNLQK